MVIGNRWVRLPQANANVRFCCANLRLNGVTGSTACHYELLRRRYRRVWAWSWVATCNMERAAGTKTREEASRLPPSQTLATRSPVLSVWLAPSPPSASDASDLENGPVAR